MNRGFSPERRRCLRWGLGAGVLALAAGVRARPKLWNPCLAAVPPALIDHPAVRAAWDGVDPARVWDCHAHIAGSGDSDSGIVVAEDMGSLAKPGQYAQRLFYLNAGCARNAPGEVDRSYVARMANLIDGFPVGARLMLFAFDRCYDEAGRPRPERTAFHVPDAYARRLAADQPERFEWVCSVHPYREDAVSALTEAVAAGARAVKWLPSAMGIDPGSAHCDAYYDALARLRLPLICHGGSERAVHGAGEFRFNNPLRLRRALDRGVRVVVAHCASAGVDDDLDRGGRGERGARMPSFELFARLMAEPAYEGLLFGDISALTLLNRAPARIADLIRRREWHGRLLNGSDYPLPGILPLFSPRLLARAGLLEPALAPVLVELQGHNPLLFDFVLKRHLRVDGVGLPASVFHTRDFFLARSL